MSELSHAWANETIATLTSSLEGMSFVVERIDVGHRGATLVLRTEGEYFATIFAASSEGPTRVIVSTGVLLDISAASEKDVLAAANAYNRTRSQGRCVVTLSSDRGLVVTLQETILPAILTNVPPFFQSFVSAFAAEARIARKFLKGKHISGSRYLWTGPADLVRLMSTIDVETDMLLDFEDLLAGE